MRLCVLWFLAAAVLGAVGPACERKAFETRAERSPTPAAASAPEAAAQRPPDARASERRGDRHARAAARHSPGVKRIAGTVTRAGGRAVAIRPAGAAPLTLRVAPGTTITVDGRPARLEALREGAEVRASYRTGGGRPTAIALEARTPATPAPTPATDPPLDPGPEGEPGGASWGTSPEPPPVGGG